MKHLKKVLLKSMSNKSLIVSVSLFLLSSCNNVKYNTFFKAAQNDTDTLYVSTSGVLTYLKQSSYWSGDGFVWGWLPYAIHLPNRNLKRIINNSQGSCFFYDNDQIVFIESVETCSPEYKQKVGSKEFLKYKGYIISKDNDNDFMKKRIKPVEDVEEIFNMSERIEAGVAPSELMEIDSIPERKHCLIVKDGIRIILFNIISNNYDFFISTLTNIYVPKNRDASDVMSFPN